MKAYVLIQTRANNEPIVEWLRAIPGVATAESLRGPYDAIAVTRSDATRQAFETIMEQVRRIPGVTRALPAPAIHPHVDVPRAERGDEAA